jgi:hypothetical protein
MAEFRQQLADVLAQLDTAVTLEFYEVNSALEPVKQAAKAAGQTVDELRFEFIAMYLILYDEPNVWGTHDGPVISNTPPLESITGECIDYWTARMNEARHPALRARYADLVWDLSQKVGKQRPIDAARIAIDGYIDAWTASPEMSFHNWGDIHQRAVDLALAINDEERLLKAVKGLREYAAADVEPSESEHRRRLLFSILMSIPPKHRPQAEFQAVVDDFRARLDKLNAAADADQFAIGDLALPLAQHYWSSQQPDEAKTVIGIYGNAVIRKSKDAMAIVATGWLKQLFQLYRQYGMKEDANQLLGTIQQRSAGVKDELAPVSHSVEIPEEEWNKVIDDLTSGSVEDVLRKLAIDFLPNVKDTEKLVKELASQTQFMNIFTQEVTTEDGRVVASIGPVAEDLEGHIVLQMCQMMKAKGQIYRPAMEQAISRLGFSARDVVAWLSGCLLFDEARHPLLESAIEAYLREDWPTAIHLAIPQIEHAMRRVLELTGQPTIKPHRNGGFMLKNLDDLLRDAATAKVIPEDIRFYLRTLLCDLRGVNVRNNVCHGIWGPEFLNSFIADRVIHAVLVIGLLRKSGPDKPEDHEQCRKGDE